MNKNDLSQISQLLDEKLEQKLEEKLQPIHQKLDEHGKMLKDHGSILDEHSKTLRDHSQAFVSITDELKKHSKLFRSLKRDQDAMLGMLDREQSRQSKRLGRIEEHLNLPAAA